MNKNPRLADVSDEASTDWNTKIWQFVTLAKKREQQLQCARTHQEPLKQVHLTSLRFFAALAVVFSHLDFLRRVENPIKPIADTFFMKAIQ